MARKTERLFLLDGMALAYRSYFAFISHPLTNAKGENVSAVFGFTNFLMNILENEKPDHIAVVFDTAEPTFRHKEFPQYKATRQKMPEDMISQIDKIKEIVAAFNIPLVELPGYEADDVIGTLAKRAEKEGVETFMVTSDKDYMQLVSRLTKMYKPGRSGSEVEVIDEQGVKEKFGVEPDQVVEVLGFTGDTSDNVPGVKGVGEKTAIPLIQEFGSIENVLDNINKIPKPSLREKLRQYRDDALLSKRLVTIETNSPVNINFHELKAAEKDIPKLAQLFSELDFRSLLGKIKAQKSTPISTATPAPRSEESDITFDFGPYEPISDVKSDKHKYSIVTTDKELGGLVTKLGASEIFSFDMETTSTNPMEAEIVGCSVAMKPREAFYIPVQTKKGEGLPLLEILKKLQPILERPRIKKCGQNIKYDMLILARHDVEMEGIEFDTMIASYALNPEDQHNLDALASQYLSYRKISITSLIGSGKTQKSMRDVPLESIAEYACEDADITLRLRDKLRSELEKYKMTSLCDDVEFPLIPVLCEMERNGVKIDVDILRDVSKELERQLQNLETDIHNLAGEEFNINSTKQLQEILFNKLRLQTSKKTKTGFSTDVSVLEELTSQHPIAERLLEYRQMTKLKSTYVDALPQLINPETQRVHTSFNQAVTATGRLSSSDPNLQNIPIRTETGREIRKAFVPQSKDRVIMSADYSQIELRVMAHISKDESLIRAFQHREDIHAATAAKVFGVNPKDVTPDMRRKAKEVNFGIMYGIGPFGLKTRLGISQTEAKEIIETYFKNYPKVQKYVAETIAKARKLGYVETLLGRRRYFTNLNSKNAAVRQFEERAAINMPIQGTAADMIKIAMINIHNAIKKEKLKSLMILQVHDELVFDVLKDEVKTMESLVTEKMKAALKLDVPVEVEVGTGKNWFEAH